MSKENIQVSIGIIKYKDLIFIQQRDGFDQFKGKWEFPGGKLKTNELPIDCLKRELFEEISFVPKNIVKITDYKYSYENINIHFHLFLCKAENIEKIKTNLNFKWIKINNLSSYCFPDANIKFIPLILKFIKNSSY